MKLNYLIPIGVAVILFNVACGRTNSVPTTEPRASETKKATPAATVVTRPSEKLAWLTDFEEAKEQARAQNKTLLINFTGSDWCPPCIMLEKEVFKQPEFVAYAAKNLVLVEVDFPRIKMQSREAKAANQKLANQFGIEGFPTVVLLDAGGQPLGALGYHDDTTAQSFIAEIEELRRADGTNAPLR